MPKPSSMFFPPSITCIQIKDKKNGFTVNSHHNFLISITHRKTQATVWGGRSTLTQRENLTLQATSTFMGLPPNSVGGEPDLEEAVLLCEDLADAAVSQRCRKRVTSSWSSIVFMCLTERKRERCKVETTTCLFETRRWQKKRDLKITWTRRSTTSSSWTSWPETSSSRQSDPAAPAGTSSGALWLGPTSAAEDGRFYTGSCTDRKTADKNRDLPASLPAGGMNRLRVWRSGYRSWPHAHDPAHMLRCHSIKNWRQQTSDSNLLFW